MFDHLVKEKKQNVRRVPAHHHGIVFVVISAVIVGVVGVNLWMYPLSAPKITFANEPSVTFWITAPDKPETAIVPVTGYPIVSLASEVFHKPVIMQSFRFALEGAYNRSDIQGLTLTLDGVQVGYPALPDSNGIVFYNLDELTLSPGKHTFEVLLSAPRLVPGTLMQVSIEHPREDLYVTIPPESIQMLWPFQAGVVRISEKGSLGMFVRPSPNGSASGSTIARFFLYAEAEDIGVTTLQIAADRKIDGSRLDLFVDNEFLASAAFREDSASFDLSDHALLILKEKNTEITLIPADIAGDIVAAGIKLRLREVSGQGLHSNKPIVLTSQSDLL